MGAFLEFAAGYLATAARWIGWVFSTWGGRMVAQVLLFFGLETVTRKFVMPEIRGLIESKFGELPTTILQLAGLLKIDVAFTIILSAIAIKYGAKGIMRLSPK